MDVQVTRRYKGQKEGSGETNVYSYSTVVNNTTVNNPANPPSTTWPEEFVFIFNETATPTITDYNTLYSAVYGPHPKLLIICYIEDPNDADNDYEQEMQDVPTRICANGVLTGFAWDLSEELSGKIIMSK